MRIPREAPGMISIAPLRASALMCSSAALGDLKPSSLAISARWRIACVDDVVTDTVEHLVLSWGQLDHITSF